MAMTIRECMDTAYQLINQYSIAGTVVPLSYNDQADNENRMINLINDAQMEIATTNKRIIETMEIDQPEIGPQTRRAWVPYDLPGDMFDFESIKYFTPYANRVLNVGDYRLSHDGKIINLPNWLAGKFVIEYARYPEIYPPDVDKNTELDNSPETHFAIPYFVGAMISLDENPKTYYELYNLWETRLSRLGVKKPHTENHAVIDVYGFENFGGVW